MWYNRQPMVPGNSTFSSFVEKPNFTRLIRSRSRQLQNIVFQEFQTFHTAVPTPKNIRLPNARIAAHQFVWASLVYASEWCYHVAPVILVIFPTPHSICQVHW